MPWLTCHNCKYHVLLGFLFLYVCATCAITCIYLWSSTTSSASTGQANAVNDEFKQNSLVHFCANDDATMIGDCTQLRAVRLQKFVARGWTKAVYESVHNGEKVAVKVINSNGKHINDCLKMKTYTECHNEVADGIRREIENLLLLTHSNIIKALSFCASNLSDVQVTCLKTAILVTELGEPVDNIKLLQMPWKERFSILVDLVRLLHYLALQPTGPMALPDLRRTQFVLVNSTLKLADVDNVLTKEQACKQDKDCSFFINGTKFKVACQEGQCEGQNERYNIAKSFLEFGPYLFIEADVPNYYLSILRKVRTAFLQHNTTTNELLQLSKQLLAA